MSNFLDNKNNNNRPPTNTSTTGITTTNNVVRTDSSGITSPSKKEEKEVQLDYPPNFPNELKLTEVQASNLKKILYKAKEYKVIINSTKRDAQSQAGAMYENHIAKKKMGYGSAGQAVLAVLDAMIASDKKAKREQDKTTKEQKIEAMKNKIESFESSTFDNQMTHLSDFTRVITVDIKQKSIKNSTNFKKVLREYDTSVLRKAKLPEDGGEPAYHLEIKL